MAMCMRYTKNRELAIEIVNSGMLKVFQKLHTYKFAGSLEGWIRRVVYHSMSDFFRKKENNLRFLEIEDRDEPIAAKATDNLYLEDVMKLVDELPPATQRVFRMYAIEGYNHREIGEVLGISSGTSKWHLAEARRLLKAKIEAQNIRFNAG